MQTEYESKTIILLNPKIPLTEFHQLQPVYTVLPLIARAVDNTNASHSPKVVIMLRYPHHWQLFVDGNMDDQTMREGGDERRGFELVDSIERNKVGSMGPSPEWIASCVKNYMDMKLGN